MIYGNLNFFRVVILFICTLSFSAPSWGEVTVPDTGFFVVDSAHIIDPPVKTRLEGWFKELEQKTGAQVKVLTVGTIEGEDFFGFVQRHAEMWKLGQKGKDNGILIALAVNERQVRIQTGYGLEAVIPDSWAGSLSREAVKQFFSKGKYSQGLYQMGVAVANQIADSEKMNRCLHRK